MDARSNTAISASQTGDRDALTSHRWDVGGADLGTVQWLAQLLAAQIAAPAVIALHGPLGAGKTTFAQAYIRGVAADPALEVTSPTYAIQQTYQTARAHITHADLYRTGGPDEVIETGLEDCFGTDLVLIEWPERALELLPRDRFEVVLTPVDEDRRDVAVCGFGSCASAAARLDAIAAFIARTGWADARIDYLKGDASPRTYARLTRTTAARGTDVARADSAAGVAGAETETRTAILMNAPRQPDGPPIRDGKPYSAIAHLAEDVRPYVAVQTALANAGVRVPDLYAGDLANGLLLLEDLGDAVVSDLVRAGARPADIFSPAVDVLAHLRAAAPPPSLPLAADLQTPADDAADQPHRLPRYDLDALMIEVELLFDWYLRWPGQAGWAIGSKTPAKADFMRRWRALLATVSDDGRWVVRDFHSPNLLVLPEEATANRAGGPAPRLGVIDFQDAVTGPAVYDLVSVLQDARVDVPAEDENFLFARYLSGLERTTGAPLTRTERIALRRDYAILGAQRATKILGIFARLSMRDGKDTYLAHIPRVYGYLQRNLRHPALADLAAWYADHIAPPEGAQINASATEMPHAAFVLCGGLGTRMRPLTQTTPKPLIKVCGRSMLDRILDRFQAAGVNNVVVNAHYLAEQIDACAASRTTPIVRVSDERAALLDTGGGAARARTLLPDGPFFIHNADSLWFDAGSNSEIGNDQTQKGMWQLPGAKTLHRMAAAFDPAAMDTLLLLVPRGLDSGYRGAGDFLLDDAGRLIRRADRPEAPHVFAGVSIVSPQFFARAPQGAFSLNLLWDTAIAQGRAYGVVHDGPWLHIGDPQALDDAERQMLTNGWC